MPLGSGRPYYNIDSLSTSEYRFSGPLETLNPACFRSISASDSPPTSPWPAIFYDGALQHESGHHEEDLGINQFGHYPSTHPNLMSVFNYESSVSPDHSIQNMIDSTPNSEDRSVSNSPPGSIELRKSRRRSHQHDRWVSIKKDVHRLYMKEGRTLPETMSEFPYMKVSERTWKLQLKKWNFDKNISKKDMAKLLAKQEQRLKTGKRTSFKYCGRELTQERLSSFQKRQKVGSGDLVPYDAATPSNVTYGTPGSTADWNEGTDHTFKLESSRDRTSSVSPQTLHIMIDFAPSHMPISTPGIYERLNWYTNGFGVALRGASCASDILDTSLKHDLSSLMTSFSMINTHDTSTNSFYLNILERARCDANMSKGLHLEDGLIRYLGAISICLDQRIGDKQILVPHIFNYINLQKALDLHLWIAAYMPCNPFEELYNLVSSNYGPDAEVTRAVSHLVTPKATSPDLAWTRLMHTLLKAVEYHREAQQPKHTMLCQLKLAELASQKQWYRIAQRLLSQTILEYVQYGVQYGPEIGLPLVYLIPDASLEWLNEWSPNIFSARSEQHDIVKTMLDASIFELQMHLGTYPAFLGRHRFDAVAIPAFCLAAVICGERCALAVKMIYEYMLIGFRSYKTEGQMECLQTECFISYTLLCRATHHASMGMEVESKLDLKAVEEIVDGMQHGFQREKMSALLDVVEKSHMGSSRYGVGRHHLYC